MKSSVDAFYDLGAVCLAVLTYYGLWWLFHRDETKSDIDTGGPLYRGNRDELS